MTKMISGKKPSKLSLPRKQHLRMQREREYQRRMNAEGELQKQKAKTVDVKSGWAYLRSKNKLHPQQVTATCRNLSRTSSGELG
jgi:hypothetical protein